MIEELCLPAASLASATQTAPLSPSRSLLLTKHTK